MTHAFSFVNDSAQQTKKITEKKSSQDKDCNDPPKPMNSARERALFSSTELTFNKFLVIKVFTRKPQVISACFF